MPLELYIGPMFAGKSTEILAILCRNKSIRRETVCITHKIDRRYSDAGEIVSHNQDSAPAIVAETLMPLLIQPKIRNADCIIIEEAQFFSDLKAFVLPLVDTLQKHVICVGLDGDSNRNPFGQILELVPHADRIHKLSAYCTRCADGTVGLFTYRSPAAPLTQINVGTTDQYEALCRRHYMEAEASKAADCEDRSAFREFVNTYIEPIQQRGTEILDYCIFFLGIYRGADAYSLFLD